MRTILRQTRGPLLGLAVLGALGFGAVTAAAGAEPASARASCGVQPSTAACADCCAGKGAGGAHWNRTTHVCTCIF
jgi:hypothetical protein